jgi:hypothetical protein
MRNINPSDVFIYKRIAALKIGFACSKTARCRNTEYYLQKDLSRKCKRCGHVETVTANTAFAGIKKLSINTFLTSLQNMQTHYMNYMGYETEVGEGKEKRSAYIMHPRMKLEKIARQLYMKPESTWRLLKRITDFFPDDFEDLTSEHFDRWIPGTMSTTEGMYKKLFTLLFKDSGDNKRTKKELLKLLVVKIEPGNDGY